jgi:hypothetical protein
VRPRLRIPPLAALAILAALIVLLVALIPRDAGAAPQQDQAGPAAASGPSGSTGTAGRVQVSGIVTDAAGKPLPDLRVVLEASRRAFSLREMRRADRDTRRVAAVTNARGEYSLTWPADPYYNYFELIVGLPLKKGEGERIEPLERQDVTQRIAKGGPVVAALVVQKPSRINAVRQFLAGLDSSDERRVYGEMGNPDEVKTVRYPDHEEVSWWYFESGRMYRFRDGALEQVVPFDPVKSF